MTHVNSLTDELEKMAKSRGIDLFGVADLSLASNYIVQQGGNALGRYDRAISLGLRLSGPIVDFVWERDNATLLNSYYHHVYQVVNPFLDSIALLIAGRLQKAGFDALPVAASLITDDRSLQGLFSHKLAANLGGLGWIGRSCLLVTSDFGPRVRFATVLTNAKLATGRPVENGCQNCRACVENCPAGAFTGRPFVPGEPREKRFDAHKCNTYLAQQKERHGASVCGICVYICPHGKASK